MNDKAMKKERGQPRFEYVLTCLYSLERKGPKGPNHVLKDMCSSDLGIDTKNTCVLAIIVEIECLVLIWWHGTRMIDEM